MAEEQFIAFEPDQIALAVLETEHFLIFSTNRGQIHVFNSALDHF